MPTQVITISFDDINNNPPIFLGHQGENLATTIQFNIENWINEYGFGNVVLLNQRKNESPYPIVVSVQDSTVTWNVNNIDTGIVGSGWCELQYYIGNVLVKSDKWRTITKEAIGAAGEPPEPWEGFLEEVAEISAKVSSDAQEAEKAARGIENMTVSAHETESGPTVEKTVDEQGIVNLDFGIPSGGALPTGGTAGQFLRKNSALDGDAIWADLPSYDGSYEATPVPLMDMILQTSQRYLDRDVVVKAIPYQEVSNEAGGKTATIGG